MASNISVPTYTIQHSGGKNSWQDGEIITANSLNKMQKQIKKNTDGFSNVVQYSNTQPTNEYNQVWIKEDKKQNERTVRLAEMDDFDNFTNNVITVSEDIPNNNINKLWIHPDSDIEIQIPTYEEFSQSKNNIQNKIDDLQNSVNNLNLKSLTATDATKGQFLVADGVGGWEWKTPTSTLDGSGLPEVDTTDNGKIPQVINGEWTMSLDIKNQLDQISVFLGSVESLTWSQRMEYVRKGLGRTMFPVGTQFNTTHGSIGNIVWDVAAHDHFSNPQSPSSHTMTLLGHYLFYNQNICWSTGNAVYYASEGLSPGNYSFVIKNRTTLTQDNNKRVYFSIINPIPVGGQIRLLTIAYNNSYFGRTAGIFQDCYATQASEIITFTADILNDAIDLGVAGTGDLNDSGCVDNGNTDYDISEIRQWLNSNAGIGEWWYPQNKFSTVGYAHSGSSHLKNWMNTRSGFMYDLDSDFLNFVIQSDYPCCSGGFSVNHTPLTEYTVRDYFTMPTSVEVGIKASADVLTIGQCLELFANSDNTKRMKYTGINTNSSIGWNLRDPKKFSSATNALRFVTANGTIDGTAAANEIRLAFMCTLA